MFEEGKGSAARGDRPSCVGIGGEGAWRDRRAKRSIPRFSFFFSSSLVVVVQLGLPSRQFSFSRFRLGVGLFWKKLAV